MQECGRVVFVEGMPTTGVSPTDGPADGPIEVMLLGATDEAKEGPVLGAKLGPALGKLLGTVEGMWLATLGVDEGENDGPSLGPALGTND